MSNTASSGTDLDDETLWEIHGVVKNAGSSRLAHKISDAIAARRASPQPVAVDEQPRFYVIEDGEHDDRIMGRYQTIEAAEAGRLELARECPGEEFAIMRHGGGLASDYADLEMLERRAKSDRVIAFSCKMHADFQDDFGSRCEEWCGNESTCCASFSELTPTVTQHPSAAPSAQIADDHAGDEQASYRDVVAELREYAGNPGYSHQDYADTMRQAAATIEALRATLFRYESDSQHPSVPVQEQSDKVDARYLHMHAKIAGDYLMSAKTTLGDQWSGALDEALNHVDYVRASLESALARQSCPPVQAGAPVEPVKELIEQYRTGYRHGYEEGRAELPAHPAQDGEDARDAVPMMEITREGWMFWHTNCTNHFGGIMREVKREPDRSLFECGSCGKFGYYQVGKAGRVCTPEVAAMAATQ